METAIVGRILALGQFAIGFDGCAQLWNLVRIFGGEAVSALVIGFSICRRPPVAQVALGIEFAPLIVKAVGNFVTDGRADRAVVSRIRLLRIKVRKLQNSQPES